METLFDLLPYLELYIISFAVLVLLALVTLVQNFLIAPLAFLNNEQTPGMPLRHGHERLSFRAARTHANSVESLPPFGWAVLVAAVSGVTPELLNWLAVIYLGFRLLFWAVYYSGIGKIAGGLRTMAFVGGLATNLAICAFALWSLILVTGFGT